MASVTVFQPDGEDSNEMVFCDACDICVHQACYGIQNIPEGNWLCRTCALNIQPGCVLCPKVGGAMKSTKSGTKWAHISCALWIPEVTIECPDKMEPITNISQIPASRWSLICSLCRERVGACIQCAVKTCKTAFHVTCAFQHGLDLKTIVDDDGLDIHMQAFCSKHSDVKDDIQKKLSASPDEVKDESMTDEERKELRSHRLKKLAEEFYKHVNPAEVAEELQLDFDLVDCLCSYWILKRKMSFDRPLLMPKTEEQSMLAKQRETLIARMNMFIRLRQDLERCRNLCYMVNKREKTRSLLYQMKEDLFHRELELLEAEDGANTEPCFAHRLTGTFYDRPEAILEAARLGEIRGEQIDRENSRSAASSATTSSGAHKMHSISDSLCLKPRRNRLSLARASRTDADSSISPPASQIQQLFREKMEVLESRRWAAASGTEVKLESDVKTGDDTVDQLSSELTKNASDASSDPEKMPVAVAAPKSECVSNGKSSEFATPVKDKMSSDSSEIFPRNANDLRKSPLRTPVKKSKQSTDTESNCADTGTKSVSVGDPVTNAKLESTDRVATKAADNADDSVKSTQKSPRNNSNAKNKTKCHFELGSQNKVDSGILTAVNKEEKASGAKSTPKRVRNTSGSSKLISSQQSPSRNLEDSNKVSLPSEMKSDVIMKKSSFKKTAATSDESAKRDRVMLTPTKAGDELKAGKITDSELSVTNEMTMADSKPKLPSSEKQRKNFAGGSSGKNKGLKSPSLVKPEKNTPVKEKSTVSEATPAGSGSSKVTSETSSAGSSKVESNAKRKLRLSKTLSKSTAAGENTSDGSSADQIKRADQFTEENSKPPESSEDGVSLNTESGAGESVHNVPKGDLAQESEPSRCTVKVDIDGTAGNENFGDKNEVKEVSLVEERLTDETKHVSQDAKKKKKKDATKLVESNDTKRLNGLKKKGAPSLVEKQQLSAIESNDETLRRKRKRTSCVAKKADGVDDRDERRGDVKPGRAPARRRRDSSRNNTTGDVKNVDVVKRPREVDQPERAAGEDIGNPTSPKNPCCFLPEESNEKRLDGMSICDSGKEHKAIDEQVSDVAVHRSVVEGTAVNEGSHLLFVPRKEMTSSGRGTVERSPLLMEDLGSIEAVTVGSDAVGEPAEDENGRNSKGKSSRSMWRAVDKPAVNDCVLPTELSAEQSRVASRSENDRVAVSIDCSKGTEEILKMAPSSQNQGPAPVRYDTGDDSFKPVIFESTSDMANANEAVPEAATTANLMNFSLLDKLCDRDAAEKASGEKIPEKNDRRTSAIPVESTFTSKLTTKKRIRRKVADNLEGSKSTEVVTKKMRTASLDAVPAAASDNDLKPSAYLSIDRIGCHGFGSGLVADKMLFYGFGAEGVGSNNISVSDHSRPTSSVSLPYEPPSWITPISESRTHLDGGPTKAFIRQPFGSNFNQLTFSSLLPVESLHKPDIVMPPVARVSADSRRDQIRADLMRRFTPGQLVVSDSIKKRVIDGLGQIAAAVRKSSPIICCHSRQKLSGGGDEGRTSLGCNRAAEDRFRSISSTRRPSAISSRSGDDDSSSSSRRLNPDRLRRKTYSDCDYVSGDELVATRSDGGSLSSEDQLVNVENDSDYRFSDDDDDFVPSSRTTVKRRRRSTVAR